MQQENNRYYELAEKWLKGTITENEMMEFSTWYDADLEDELNIPPSFAGSEEELRRRILAKVNSRRKGGRVFSMINRSAVRWAAASVVVVGMGLVFYSVWNLNSPHSHVAVDKLSKEETIVPGGNKAKLVLGDGTEILLDTANSGTLTQNGSVKVIKLHDGQLACSGAAPEKSVVSFNTLTTPRGGQYAITLTDGTKVWLNSVSSLRFPTSFTGADRTVELTGEGYFEVAHDPSKPFLVKVNDIEARVLGTQFNIMAYPDEESVRTTLLEGSVRINQHSQSVLLKPGQQARITNSKSISVINDADTDQAVAWKNGVFDFDGSDIETTMRQISRWYDINVVYESKITEHFNGAIVRNSSIEKVLQLLEYTGVVHFKIQGRKVFVLSSDEN
jgi:ferric-dicitrate binding protein FerR (iron transport regulator)